MLVLAVCLVVVCAQICRQNNTTSYGDGLLRRIRHNLFCALIMYTILILRDIFREMKIRQLGLLSLSEGYNHRIIRFLMNLEHKILHMTTTALVEFLVS